MRLIIVSFILTLTQSAIFTAAEDKNGFHDPDLSLSQFFDSCQSRRPKGESRKKSTFFYFDENGNKLKILEKFLVLTFRDK